MFWQAYISEHIFTIKFALVVRTRTSGLIDLAHQRPNGTSGPSPKQRPTPSLPVPVSCRTPPEADSTAPMAAPPRLKLRTIPKAHAAFGQSWSRIDRCSAGEGLSARNRPSRRLKILLLHLRQEQRHALELTQCPAIRSPMEPLSSPIPHNSKHHSGRQGPRATVLVRREPKGAPGHRSHVRP
jgi:hypothetical protein